MIATKSKPLVVKVTRVLHVRDRPQNPLWFNPAYLLGTGATNPLVVQSQHLVPIEPKGVQYNSKMEIVPEPPSPQYFSCNA